MNEDVSADASMDESIGGSMDIVLKSTETSMNTSVESVLVQYSDFQNSGVEIFTQQWWFDSAAANDLR